MLPLPLHSPASSPLLSRPQELAHVANSLIGDEVLGIKGISGGEKRRTSVGIELVKDPAVLFLVGPCCPCCSACSAFQCSPAKPSFH